MHCDINYLFIYCLYLNTFLCHHVCCEIFMCIILLFVVFMADAAANDDEMACNFRLDE